MPRRRKTRAKQAAEEVSERAEELAGQAKDLAESGGEAVRDFATTTGRAAKDFANKAVDAAKEMLETVEQAGERLEESTKPKRRRGRRVLKATLAVGAGAALLTNEKVRNTVSQAISRVRGEQPEPWTPPPVSTPDEVSQSAGS